MGTQKIKILITGGFGAFGFNLIRILLEQGNADIHVLDNLSSGFVNFSSEVAFTHLDISNKEKLSSFCKTYQPDYIFHLAAHFANQNSVDHPISDASTNVLGIINLFETQRDNRALKKIVYTSSSCVYGNSVVMTEDSPIVPFDTPYAINKYVGELYCKYYAEIYSIPVACARIFNSYGPGEMPGQYRNVVPNFIQKALRGEDIIITGTGEETRDFTYVSDSIDLLLKLAYSEYTKAEVFNGGTGVPTTIKFLAETIVKYTQSKSKIIYTKARNWDHIKDRRSNITKSKDKLGYLPKVNLETGLIETIQWIRSKQK